MKQPIYIVDAFTKNLFGGNPAAVCPMKEWLPNELLQNIAMENNLSETAFFVKNGDHYDIRWMTPTTEVPLCGHATLASSFVIFNFIDKDVSEIRFNSKSGELVITSNSNLITLNFPSNIPEKTEPNEKVGLALGKEPKELYFNKSYLAVFESQKEILDIKPDFRTFEEVHSDGIIITAKGEGVDFVSRYFVPSAGIDEDPVTGFAHTLLTPFWSERLGKKKMNAKQISKRGGELILENLGNRVNISGAAVLYSVGEINL
ncbi:MAG: PhzF family phenazine biosynthesis protein [Ignavibacteria bacterium]|jgi:PhzF family phenazine biosynthesis protein